MSALKTPTCKVLKDNLANYSLLEIVHHEMGNGLAVVTGYTRLLQRLNVEQENQRSPGEADAGKQYREKRDDYLQTIAQRETQLNDFLAHIRGFSLYPPHARFHQNVSQVDLALLLQNVTHRLLPLHKNCNIQIYHPEQPLYVMCDPPWIELMWEHVINHNMAFHQGSTPIQIDLICCPHPTRLIQEVQMRIHILKRSPKRQPVAEENTFEIWSQTVDQRDQDVCMALCTEILQEHGGRIWSEQEKGRRACMSVSLPL